jgi:3-phenylpropionate/trans-cinnamate dioxygenase ferredoxin reductase component
MSAGVVIVGGGQAAAVATRTLRRRGYDGSITVIGEEPEWPYQRPPLSKEYLLGREDSELYLLPEDWVSQKDIRIRVGARAMRVRPSDGAVELEDGSLVPADQVLIATGGRPRRFADAAGDRIRYLRTKADCDVLRSELTPGARVLIVGGGFIGSEVASSARELGAAVTVLEAAPLPLQGLLGTELATACIRLPREAGVDLRCGVSVTSITQHGDEVSVQTDDGHHVGDLVVVGIGMVPNDDIATTSGITVDNGIWVDEHCRTSLPQVYAAGDVANHYHPLFDTRMRVEHFDNANRQAAVAANNMLGRDTVHDDAHWFWSDQYGANLQYAGHAAGADQVVVRGSCEDDAWSAFFLARGVVRAAFAVDRSEDVMVARELINARHAVPVDVLTDTSTDLLEILEQE